jgi:hypothetical protein
MLHNHINKALSLLNFHQYYVEDLEEVFQMDEEAKFNEMFSEDEATVNKNVCKEVGLDDDFLHYCQGELDRHRHELERAKVRLNICMLTFNKGGWTF